MKDQPIIKVRRAGCSDIKNVAEIELSSFPSDRVLGIAELEQLMSQKTTMLLVAENSDGCCLGFSCNIAEGKLMHIISIAVIPDARHQGVASELLAKAIDSAISTDTSIIYAEIRKSNIASQRLFSSMGFQIREIVSGYYSNPNEDAIIVQLCLNK